MSDIRDYDKKDRFKTRYNYKLTDFQAAMGQDQISRLGAVIERRKKIGRKLLSGQGKRLFNFLMQQCRILRMLRPHELCK